MAKKQLFSASHNVRKNVMNLIFVVVIVLGFVGIWGVGALQSWMTLGTEIKTSEQNIKLMTKENDLLQKDIAAQEKILADKLAASTEREKQTLPEEINTGVIAKTLELYGISLENLDSLSKDAHFEVQKLWFSNQPEESTDYMMTDMKIGISTDQENLETFITYLQSGTIGERIRRGVVNRQIPESELRFLENNPLPVMTIDRVSMTQSEEFSNRMTLDLDITLYSQK